MVYRAICDHLLLSTPRTPSQKAGLSPHKHTPFQLQNHRQSNCVRNRPHTHLGTACSSALVSSQTPVIGLGWVH